MPRVPDEKLIQQSESQTARLFQFYSEAEVEILAEINKGLLKGNDTRYLQTMHQNVLSILNDLLAGSRTWCDEAIPWVYMEAAKAADNQLVSMGANTIGGFGAIHQQAAQVLAEAAYNRFDDVAQTIGRRVDDIYRTLALENIKGSVVGYKSWQQVARNFREQLAEQGITAFKDIKGRNWNMRTYAEMVARTTTMEAHLEGTANRLLEHGYDLVKVSTHSGTCEKCAPWQGEILSLTGKTKDYPTLQEAKDAGLFHPRCRHAYGLYIDLDEEIADIEKEGRGGDTTEQVPGAFEQAVKRQFKEISTIKPEVYNVLKKAYGIKDPALTISQDTTEHIAKGHPELSSNIPNIVNDIIRNAAFIQRNKRNDTVRVIAFNDELSEPIQEYSAGKYVVMVLRLQPQHPVNFVKALYPREKIRKSDIIWSKKEQ